MAMVRCMTKPCLSLVSGQWRWLRLAVHGGGRIRPRAVSQDRPHVGEPFQSASRWSQARASNWACPANVIEAWYDVNTQEPLPMLDRTMPIIAIEVVECMTEGRDPSVQELFSVARRIWSESSPTLSAFGWERLAATAPERVRSLRAARAALCGAPDLDKGGGAIETLT